MESGKVSTERAETFLGAKTNPLSANADRGFVFVPRKVSERSALTLPLSMLFSEQKKTPRKVGFF